MEYIQEPGRICLKDNNDVVIAQILYEKAGDEGYTITHTIVDPELRGQGIAGTLVEMAVAEIQKEGARVTASCPFAAKWLADHADVMNEELSSSQ